MPRPCHCDRFDAAGFRPGLDCPRCYAWHTSADYRAYHEGRPAAADHTAAESVPPCVHYVDAPAVRGPDAPDTLRDWRQCPRGHGIVCPCRPPCGPACPDYEASD